MKFAFYVDSPYQLLNCINFVWNNTEQSRGHTDLYLANSETVFKPYHNLIPMLQSSNLFSNIFLIRIDNFHKFKIISFIRNTIRVILPRYTIKRFCSSGIIKKDYYNFIIFSYPHPLVVGLISLNKKAHVWINDDGSGCYYGKFLNFYTSKTSHLHKIMFNRGMETITPSRLYVNNVDLCKSSLNVEITQLPILSNNKKELINFLYNVFGEGYDNELCRKKFIFLSQPLTEMGACPKVIYTFFSYIKKNYNNIFIVRKHPREKDFDYSGMVIDNQMPMWEMFCLTSLKEDQYLIGVFSTAQITPKILFDKEPNVIFLYKISGMYPNDLYYKVQEIDAFVQSFRNSYREKDKVYIPETIDELKSIITV